MIPCRLCGDQAVHTHSTTVMRKYRVGYYLCPNCDLLQSESPYWLDEAYRQSLSSLDTGSIHRNWMTSKRVAQFCFLHGLEKIRGVDFAGGYGILVRLLRDFGLDFYWTDKYSPNLASIGFEADEELKYGVVTAFEVMEHFAEPGSELRELLEKRDPRFLLFETVLRENRSVPGPAWKYYAPQSGQHVAFYSRITCEFIASKFSYHFWRHGRLLVLSKEVPRMSFSKWFGLPRAVLKTHFPDAIPFIRRDQEEIEKRLEGIQVESDANRSR